MAPNCISKIIYLHNLLSIARACLFSSILIGWLSGLPLEVALLQVIVRTRRLLPEIITNVPCRS